MTDVASEISWLCFCLRTSSVPVPPSPYVNVPIQSLEIKAALLNRLDDREDALRKLVIKQSLEIPFLERSLLERSNDLPNTISTHLPPELTHSPCR